MVDAADVLGVGTIAGGVGNENSGYASSLGGGWDNTVSADLSVVAGGWKNTASGERSTVAGGNGATASGFGSAVGGGEYCHATGNYATVPGGVRNEANGRGSFAAGAWAHAEHEGAFVWADYSDAGTDFASTGTNQFLVRAEGGVGIGTNAPTTPLHVVGDDGGSNSGGHVALVETPNDDNDNQLLALKTGYTGDPGSLNNFVTFFDGTDAAYGAIQGNGSGGVALVSGSADYAEYLPRLDPDEEIDAAEVVGVVDGTVTRRTADADRVLVVSDQPIVTGNSPGPDEVDRADHETVAFVGQVPVNVRGSVECGDVLVPSGEDDGTAVGIAPGEWTAGAGPVVGQAWGGYDGDGVGTVTVAVGIDDPARFAAWLDERIDELAVGAETLRTKLVAENDDLRADLEAENDDLRAENERLRERTADLEDRLEAVEDHLGSGGAANRPGVADD